MIGYHLVAFLAVSCVARAAAMGSTTGSVDPIRRHSRRSVKAEGLIKFVPQFVHELGEIWLSMLANPNETVAEAVLGSRKHRVLRRLINLNENIKDLEDTVQIVGDRTTATILESFPSIVELELALNEFTKIINQINFARDKLQEYLIIRYNKSGPAEKRFPLVDSSSDMANTLYATSLDEKPDGEHQRFEDYTLLDFAQWAVGYQSNSVQTQLNNLHNLIYPQKIFGLRGMVDLIRDVSQEARSNVCNLKQSPYQVLYNLYNTIVLTELKGNAILQFSYMLLRLYGKGNFAVETKLAQEKYEKRIEQTKNLAKTVLATADRSVFRCDPKQYVEGVTYTRLTKLLQGYIENEVNLNPYGTCMENCAFYEFTQINGCFKEQFCSKQPPCKGKILNCKYVDSDMDICTASRNSDRRYDWIEYENGQVLGNKGVCESKNLFKVDSWWRYLFWHCSYCFCLCDDDDNSDRYFNLRDVTSDVNENKVVTGVRLVKNNRIIHIQIQQGVLGPRGLIDNTTLSWKPVDNYTVDDHNVENNVDYHAMTWLERTIDTDDIHAPPEHVVTGVRFRKLGSHLNLEVRVNPIDFAAGTVSSEQHSTWQGNDNTDASYNNPRTEIILQNPDVPIRQGPHTLNSNHDQYIQFQSSNFRTDAAQSTVPFIDSQALTSQGFPISGLGLIHRGKSGSGGFIAPKLISYDFSPHLS